MNLKMGIPFAKMNMLGKHLTSKHKNEARMSGIDNGFRMVVDTRP